MINIPSTSKSFLDKNSLKHINKISHRNILTNQTITNINIPSQHDFSSIQNHAIPTTPQLNINSPTLSTLTVPHLNNPIAKGQKITLFPGNPPSKIKVTLGWNVTNAQCDIDVSAFLLGENGKVLGDSWFVFYGETTSPDDSIHLNTTPPSEREIITVDFRKLHPNVKKIVFVLTINEAFEKNLNFSMVKDAYIRILSATNQTELVSFKMEEYYNNVISMMIGEIYQYHDTWKFNAIGNGVDKDLAGLCGLYGVDVI